MATFLKDVLYPGKVKPLGFEDPIEFTSEDAPEGITASGAVSIPFLHRRMKDMLADNLQIPVSWEHQDKAKPMTAAEWAQHKAELEKLTLGWAADSALDGQILTARVEVPVEEDAKKIPAIRFISPEIKWDFQDGRGRVWKGPSTTHLAVTSRPVQHDQKPFQPATLSLLRLSLGDYAMAEETKKEEKKPEKNESKEGEKNDGVEGESGKLKKVLACLEELGMVLGEDTTIENLLERLHTAALTKQAAENPMATTEAEHEASMPASVAMSLAKVADPALRLELAKTFKLSLGKGSPAAPTGLAANLLKREREDLGRRIKALPDFFVNKPTKDKLLAELKTVQLSLDASGEVAPNGLTQTIAAYEALGPAPHWAPIELSMGGEREAAQPKYGPEPTPAEANKAIDGFCRMVGMSVK